jgi:hypothetical protein
MRGSAQASHPRRSHNRRFPCAAECRRRGGPLIYGWRIRGGGSWRIEAEVLDQITRYYYNFGKETKFPESSFYAEDGALILGTRRYEGRDAIQSAYGGGARPAPAAGEAPAAPRERIPFNMTVDNVLIFVHGDTATSHVIYTEYRPEKKNP